MSCASSKFSLPPKVQGKVRGHLKIGVDSVSLNERFEGPNTNPIICKVLWWGQSDDEATILHPCVTFVNSNYGTLAYEKEARKDDCRQMYSIRSIPRRLLAYFTDMSQLMIEIYQCNKAWSQRHCLQYFKKTSIKDDKIGINNKNEDFSLIGKTMVDLSCLQTSAIIDGLYHILSVKNELIGEIHVRLFVQYFSSNHFNKCHENCNHSNNNINNPMYKLHNGNNNNSNDETKYEHLRKRNLQNGNNNNESIDMKIEGQSMKLSKYSHNSYNQASTQSSTLPQSNILTNDSNSVNFDLPNPNAPRKQRPSFKIEDRRSDMNNDFFDDIGNSTELVKQASEPPKPYKSILKNGNNEHDNDDNDNDDLTANKENKNGNEYLSDEMNNQEFVDNTKENKNNKEIGNNKTFQSDSDLNENDTSETLQIERKLQALEDATRQGHDREKLFKQLFLQENIDDDTIVSINTYPSFLNELRHETKMVTVTNDENTMMPIPRIKFDTSIVNTVNNNNNNENNNEHKNETTRKITLDNGISINKSDFEIKFDFLYHFLFELKILDIEIYQPAMPIHEKSKMKLTFHLPPISSNNNNSNGGDINGSIEIPTDISNEMKKHISRFESKNKPYPIEYPVNHTFQTPLILSNNDLASWKQPNKEILFELVLPTVPQSSPIRRKKETLMNRSNMSNIEHINKSVQGCINILDIFEIDENNDTKQGMKLKNTKNDTIEVDIYQLKYKKPYTGARLEFERETNFYDPNFTKLAPKKELIGKINVKINLNFNKCDRIPKMNENDVSLLQETKMKRKIRELQANCNNNNNDSSDEEMMSDKENNHSKSNTNKQVIFRNPMANNNNHGKDCNDDNNDNKETNQSIIGIQYPKPQTVDIMSFSPKNENRLNLESDKMEHNLPKNGDFLVGYLRLENFEIDSIISQHRRCQISFSYDLFENGNQIESKPNEMVNDNKGCFKHESMNKFCVSQEWLDKILSISQIDFKKLSKKGKYNNDNSLCINIWNHGSPNSNDESFLVKPQLIGTVFIPLYKIKETLLNGNYVKFVTQSLSMPCILAKQIVINCQLLIIAPKNDVNTQKEFNQIGKINVFFGIGSLTQMNRLSDLINSTILVQSYFKMYQCRKYFKFYQKQEMIEAKTIKQTKFKDEPNAQLPIDLYPSKKLRNNNNDESMENLAMLLNTHSISNKNNDRVLSPQIPSLAIANVPIQDGIDVGSDSDENGSDIENASMFFIDNVDDNSTFLSKSKHNYNNNNSIGHDYGYNRGIKKKNDKSMLQSPLISHEFEIHLSHISGKLAQCIYSSQILNEHFEKEETRGNENDYNGDHRNFHLCVRYRFPTDVSNATTKLTPVIYQNEMEMKDIILDFDYKHKFSSKSKDFNPTKHRQIHDLCQYLNDIHGSIIFEIYILNSDLLKKQDTTKVTKHGNDQHMLYIANAVLSVNKLIDLCKMDDETMELQLPLHLTNYAMTQSNIKNMFLFLKLCYHYKDNNMNQTQMMNHQESNMLSNIESQPINLEIQILRATGLKHLFNLLFRRFAHIKPMIDDDNINSVITYHFEGGNEHCKSMINGHTSIMSKSKCPEYMHTCEFNGIDSNSFASQNSKIIFTIGYALDPQIVKNDSKNIIPTMMLEKIDKTETNNKQDMIVLGSCEIQLNDIFQNLNHIHSRRWYVIKPHTLLFQSSSDEINEEPISMDALSAAVEISIQMTNNTANNSNNNDNSNMYNAANHSDTGSPVMYNQSQQQSSPIFERTQQQTLSYNNLFGFNRNNDNNGDNNHNNNNNNNNSNTNDDGNGNKNERRNEPTSLKQRVRNIMNCENNNDNDNEMKDETNDITPRNNQSFDCRVTVMIEEMMVGNDTNTNDGNDNNNGNRKKREYYVVYKLFKTDQQSSKLPGNMLQHTATFVTKKTGDLFNSFFNENQLILELWEAIKDSKYESQSDRLIGTTYIDLSQFNGSNNNNHGNKTKKIITGVYDITPVTHSQNRINKKQSYFDHNQSIDVSNDNEIETSMKLRIRILLQIEPHSSEATQSLSNNQFMKMENDKNEDKLSRVFLEDLEFEQKYQSPREPIAAKSYIQTINNEQQQQRPKSATKSGLLGIPESSHGISIQQQQEQQQQQQRPWSSQSHIKTAKTRKHLLSSSPSRPQSDHFHRNVTMKQEHKNENEIENENENENEEEIDYSKPKSLNNSFSKIVSPSMTLQINIDQANGLPNLSNQLAPNTYACLRIITNPTKLFNSTSKHKNDNVSRMDKNRFDNVRKSLAYRTHVAWNTCNPHWNCNTNMSLSHLWPLIKNVNNNHNNNNNNLSSNVKSLLNETIASIEIWHKCKDNFGINNSLISFENAVFEDDKDNLIGISNVELSSLVIGFPQICGWYNINDFKGDIQGQIYICIAPRDDLKEILDMPSSLLSQSHSQSMYIDTNNKNSNNDNNTNNNNNNDNWYNNGYYQYTSLNEFHTRTESLDNVVYNNKRKKDTKVDLSQTYDFSYYRHNNSKYDKNNNNYDDSSKDDESRFSDLRSTLDDLSKLNLRLKSFTIDNDNIDNIDNNDKSASTTQLIQSNTIDNDTIDDNYYSSPMKTKRSFLPSSTMFDSSNDNGNNNNNIINHNDKSNINYDDRTFDYYNRLSNNIMEQHARLQAKFESKDSQSFEKLSISELTKSIENIKIPKIACETMTNCESNENENEWESESPAMMNDKIVYNERNENRKHSGKSNLFNGDRENVNGRYGSDSSSSSENENENENENNKNEINEKIEEKLDIVDEANTRRDSVKYKKDNNKNRNEDIDDSDDDDDDDNDDDNDDGTSGSESGSSNEDDNENDNRNEEHEHHHVHNIIETEKTENRIPRINYAQKPPLPPMTKHKSVKQTMDATKKNVSTSRFAQLRQAAPFQLGNDDNASFAKEKIDRIAQIMRGNTK